MKKLLRQLLLAACVLSAPLIVLLLDLPADVFAGCGGYGYSCQQPVCFGLEVTTDSGSTWKDGSATIYGAPGTQVSVTVRTVLSVSSGNSVQGWSFSVRPDAATLLNAGGNFEQSAAEESSLSYINCGSPPDFEDTRLRPCGYTQGVLVDTGGSGCDLTGPVLIVTSEACFDVTFPSTQGIFPVTLAFTDDIGDPPVQSIAVRAGQSEIPCKFGLTLNLYSTTSYYPTPSYCPLTPQTPLACGGGGSGAGAGAALPGRDFLRGDANQDGSLNLSDAVEALSFLFLGGSGPEACRDAVDSNDDGALNLADPVYSLSYLFLGGPALPNPGPTQCGPDLTADNLDCLSFNEVECPWIDSDCDGLSDAFEVIIGTEPGDPNCNCFDEGQDEDGIPEVDCDGDGLADVDPGSGALLTPFGWDTDGDGFSDGQECLPSGVPGLNGASLNIAELGANPLIPDIFIEIDWMGDNEDCPCADLDGDGVPGTDCDGDGVEDLDSCECIDLGNGTFGLDCDEPWDNEDCPCIDFGEEPNTNWGTDCDGNGAKDIGRCDCVELPDGTVEKICGPLSEVVDPPVGHEHRPDLEALALVRQMFRAANVFPCPDGTASDPDGECGIAIHIDAGPNSVMRVEVDEATKEETAVFTWGNFSQSSRLPHNRILPNYLASLVNGVDSSIRDTAIAVEVIHFDRDARSRVFHYCLAGHYSQGTVHGKAEWAGARGGDTFAITLPDTAFDANGNFLPGLRPKYAEIFAHEFGHVLSLGHAPDFDRPTDTHGIVYYRSIMNLPRAASCQTTCEGGFIFPSPEILDYSNEELGPFNEAAVDDSRGMCIIDGQNIAGAQPFDFNANGTCDDAPYEWNLDQDDNEVDLLPVKGRNDWKTLRHFNNSRDERAEEELNPLSLGGWSDCTEVFSP